MTEKLVNMNNAHSTSKWDEDFKILKSRFESSGQIKTVFESTASGNSFMKTINSVPNIRTFLGDYDSETKVAFIVALLKLSSVSLSDLNLKECPFWRHRETIPINDLHFNHCNFCFFAKEGIVDLIKERLKNEW